MSDFDKALTFALTWEGVYSADHGDPGNWTGGDVGKGELRGTKIGVSARAYPMLDIKNLTKEEAATDVYLPDYWIKYKCDQMPYPVNIVHFDCCVNVGNITLRPKGVVEKHNRANKMLQRAASVEDDGIIGPATLRAIQNDNPQFLALSAINERDSYYETLAKQSAYFASCLKGWKNRTEALRAIIT